MNVAKLAALVAMVAGVAQAGAPAKCGDETCAPAQFCEDAYKGHGADEQGRPLKRLACVPFPARCEKTPTCVCLLKVHYTSCRVEAGAIFAGDAPVPATKPPARPPAHP